MTRFATPLAALLSAPALLALCACATAPSAEQFHARMESDLSRFVGQKVQAAVSRIGPEDHLARGGPVNTYAWNGERTIDTRQFNTVTSDGHVGLVSMLGNANYARYAPAADRCQVELDVGRQGAILAYRWSGNVIGCAGYAQALER